MKGAMQTKALTAGNDDRDREVRQTRDNDRSRESNDRTHADRVRLGRHNDRRTDRLELSTASLDQPQADRVRNAACDRLAAKRGRVVVSVSFALNAIPDRDSSDIRFRCQVVDQTMASIAAVARELGVERNLQFYATIEPGIEVPREDSFRELRERLRADFPRIGHRIRIRRARLQ